MANQYSNTVIFIENEELADKILQLFTTMMEQEKKSGEGQIPDFIQNKIDFSLKLTKTKQINVVFDTKPNGDQISKFCI